MKPQLIVRAKHGTGTEARLTRAAAAGLKAIFRDIKRVQHARRELVMQDQKLQQEEQTAIDDLKEAWAEQCEKHGLDPNVPIDYWTINKKNKAVLDAKCHPAKEEEHPSSNAPGSADDVGDESEQPGTDGVPAEGDNER